MANLKVGLDAVVDKNGFIQNYPLGTVIISMSSSIPNGWLLCDGSYANTADYPELDAHLGTTYGARVGGTFKLPPLVYNSTYNTSPRMPFSTITSEPSYPNDFNHAHNVTVNSYYFSDATHTHNHNSNTAASNNDNHSHNHGTITGSADISNSSANPTPGSTNLFSATRSAGPSGPYASGNTQANITHTHAAAAYNVPSQNQNYVHAHNVTIHTQTNYNHTHNTNIASSSHSVNYSDMFPLSKQVYFLIKT
jgi:microcystin-dependent protein